MNDNRYLFTSPLGAVQSIVICMFVSQLICLFGVLVCLSVLHILKTLWPNSTNFLLTVAWSSSGGIEKRYLLRGPDLQTFLRSS